MNAFVCILDRSGANLEPAALQRLTGPLESYGGELSTVCRGPAGIALRRPVSTPTEHHGPLTDGETGWTLAVAGRFLPLTAVAGEGRLDTGDAGLACAATALDHLKREDSTFIARVCGAFVIVAAQPARGRMTITRDHLGELKVYYYLGSRWFIAASEPTAILRHSAVRCDLDPHSAARFLGFRFDVDERSFFRGIHELPPGHEMTVTRTERQIRRYWRFRRRQAPRPEEVVHSFRNLLTRSIEAHSAAHSANQTALSLSGGLDSTTLASLAPPGVRAFSWRFDELAECDERINIQAVADHLRMPLHWIQGDGLTPLEEGWSERFVHRNSPHVNAFAALKQALYRTASQAGCQRMLVGDAGDALYAASEYWLRDSLRDSVAAAPWRLIRTAVAAVRGDGFARLSLRRLLSAPTPNQRRPRRPWLTDIGHSLLPAPSRSPILPDTPRAHRHELTVGAKHTELESEEARLFARCGIERGNPYWHWPLLEMVINLPAWWLHRNGRHKILTREAARGRLPEAVLNSSRGGLLGAFFLQGIERRRERIREQVFRRPSSDWQRYVERAWIEPYLEATDSILFGHTVLWRVICYELWQRKLLGLQTGE